MDKWIWCAFVLLGQACTTATQPAAAPYSGASPELAEDKEARTEQEAAESLWIELRAQAEVRGHRWAMREGDYLRSGDRLEFLVTASREASVYMYYVTSQGETSRLYPPKDSPEFRISSNMSTRVPVRGWIVLDEDVGEETVIVVASAEPLEDVDAVAASALGRLDRERRVEEEADYTARCSELSGEGIPKKAVVGSVGVPGVDDTRDQKQAPAPSTADPKRGFVGESVQRVAVVPEEAFAVPSLPRLRNKAAAGQVRVKENVYAPKTRGVPGLGSRGLTYVVEEDDESALLFEADQDSVIVKTFSFCHRPSALGIGGSEE